MLEAAIVRFECNGCSSDWQRLALQVGEKWSSMSSAAQQRVATCGWAMQRNDVRAQSVTPPCVNPHNGWTTRASPASGTHQAKIGNLHAAIVLDHLLKGHVGMPSQHQVLGLEVAGRG